MTTGIKLHLSISLYSLNFETKEKTCITCDMIEGCSYYSANFNDKSTRYILQCHGPEVPQTFLNSIDSVNYTVLVDNSGVKEALAEKVSCGRVRFNLKEDRKYFFIPP